MGFFGNIDFQNLTYTERVIYNYLKNNTDKIPYMHVREIATQAHAGSSSVMRLIHKMGYNSFNEFKTYLKKNEINAYNETNFYQFSLKDYPDNLSDILEDMARQIVESDHLIFTGIGASGLICDYASRRFAGIGINSFSFSDVTYPIASITGRSKSTIADLSDIVLPYIVEERRVDLHFDLSSQLPAVFLIEQLSELVYRKMKE